MCFQKFITFQCGCRRLEEQECEHAQRLDINFWQKIDCPYYTTTRKHCWTQCGAGEFYCGATDDGGIFDAVDEMHVKASYQHKVMAIRLVKGKELLRQQCDEWVANGGPLEVFQECQQARDCWGSLALIDFERKRLENEINNWLIVKRLARAHDERRQLRLQAGLPSWPSFADFLKVNHPQAFARLDRDDFAASSSIAPPNTGTANMALVAHVNTFDQSSVLGAPSSVANIPPRPPAPSSHHGIGIRRDASRFSVRRRVIHESQTPIPQSDLTEPSRGHTTTSLNPDLVRTQRLAAIEMVTSEIQREANRQRTDAVAQNSIPEVQAYHRQLAADAAHAAAQDAIPEQAHQKRRGRFKKQEPEVSLSPEKSSSKVRRSTRVKAKKVNYNVDDSSDVSRSSSPAKSDVSISLSRMSGLSDKSAKSRGNSKKKETVTGNSNFLARGKANLADQIGEWSRSDSVVGTPPREPDQHTGGKKRKPEQHVTEKEDHVRLKQEPMQDQAFFVSTGVTEPAREFQQPSNSSQQPIPRNQADARSEMSPLSTSGRSPSPSKRPISAPTPPYSGYTQDPYGPPDFPGSSIMAPSFSIPNPFRNTAMNQLFHGVRPTSTQRPSSAGYLVSPANGYVSYQGFADPNELEVTAGNVQDMVQESAASPELSMEYSLRSDENTYSDVDWSILDADATL